MEKKPFKGLNRYAELSTANSQVSESKPPVNNFQPQESQPEYTPPADYPDNNGYINEASQYTYKQPTKPTAGPISDQKPRRRSSKSKQIDIDKIPRPDINAESSYLPKTYETSSLNNPPHSFENFITLDDGNAGPRYIRSSLYKFPTEESILNNLQVPLGLIVQPLADPSPDEEAVPIVDFGESGPFRCNRCRAYVNPNWTFTQNGSFAVCNLCRMNNEVPKEYYSPLEADGTRIDKAERPELSKGVYEFLAPSVYNTRSQVTPNILLCIEVSSASYLSGIFHQILSSLQSLLDYTPSPELTNICIVTYDTGVNFFKVPDDLSKEITIINIPDIETACVPFPKSHLFMNLQNERDKINYLIEKIIKHYESNEKIQKGYATCFGAALASSCEILLKDGGRVLTFATQAPVGGLGKLNKRDDYKLYGTEKEKTLYVPQTDLYNTWAKSWLEKRISVDLFCFSHEYFDLATLGQVSGITGGNIYYYPNYKATYDGEKLHYDLSRNLTRYTGYDAVMTIRTCQGISFLDYVTPTGRRPVPEIDFAAIDADTTINIYLKHDDKLAGDVAFQIAMLYSNPYGQRVIRVLNYKLNTSNDILTLFRSCDVETVGQLIIKRNIINISTLQISQIRKNMTDLLVSILYNYRFHCASSSSHSQLILPDSLKTLPIYVLAAFKAHILRTGGDTRSDDRFYDVFRLVKMPINVMSNLFYIKIYPLHTIWTDEEYAPGNLVGSRTVLSRNLPATIEKLDDDGIFLLDNGEFLFIYVKKDADPIIIQNLFGVETFQEVYNLTNLPEYIESEYFVKVSNIIDQLRKNKNASYQPVRIVTEKDPSESQLLNLLMEDERLGDSYSTFLCNIHKLIQDKLS